MSVYNSLFVIFIEMLFAVEVQNSTGINVLISDFISQYIKELKRQKINVAIF